MNNTRKLKVEDVVDNIKLDPKKSDHTDWDVLVAVGEYLRLRFDAEKLNEFTSKATNDDDDGGGYYIQIANRGVKRKTSMNELSYHSSSKKIVTMSEVEEFNFSKKHPRSSTSVNDDDPLAVVNTFKNDNIGIPKKARESGGILFGTKKSPDEVDYNKSFLICKSYVRQPASTPDISKLEKRMKMESEKVLFKKSILKLEYPEGMSKEEVVRRERLLKEPIMFNDQEENGQKDVIQKRLRCTKGSFEKDYYLSDGEEEWDEYDSKKKKKKKKSTGRCTSKKGGKSEKGSRNSMKVEVSYPPPDLPIEFEKRILEKGGTDIRLVIQKALSNTDCSKDENRLFISIRTAANFLEESEKKYLQSGTGIRTPKPFINVLLLPPNLEETAITLRQWNLYKESGKVSGQYVLNKPWYDVVTSNGLAKNVIIQIWSFRVDGKLGLAMVKLPEHHQEQVDVGKSTRTGGSEGTSTSSGGATKKSSSGSPPPSSLDNVN